MILHSIMSVIPSFNNTTAQVHTLRAQNERNNTFYEHNIESYNVHSTPGFSEYSFRK